MESLESRYLWPHRTSTTVLLEQTLGIHLAPWQLEVSETWNTSKLLVRAERGVGKSTLALFLGLREAWQWGRSANLICANQSVAQRLAQKLLTSVPACHITQQSQFSFQFDSGGTLRIASSFCPSCNSKLLVVDDAVGRVEEEEIQRALGVHGRVVMFSTWGQEELFTDLWLYGGLSWQRLEVGPVPAK